MSKDIQVRNEGSRFPFLPFEWDDSMDIKENDKAFVLRAEVPGVPLEDVDISVSGAMLRIKAENEAKTDDEGGYLRQYRSFEQSFTLPSNVDADNIEAHCENGVLEVWLPKTNGASSRKVEVSTGKGGFLKRLFGKDDKEQKNKKH